ncbi:MAG: hypothetical protein RIM83_09220 [Allomuricauda sp.]
MQEEIDSSKLSFDRWDISFVGKPLDDRGDEATTFIKENSKEVIEIKYNAYEMTFKYGSKTVLIDDLDDVFTFLQSKNILIEATTMSFAELLLLLKQAKINDCDISILYLEPRSYAQIRTPLIIHRREFELSQETPGFFPIPGFIKSYSPDKIRRTIFIAGYESERIDRAIEENSISSNNCALIFGVPAFQAGWEMNSFANNISVIKEQRIMGEPYFSSANNPGATYDILEEIYMSLDSEEEMYIAPLGPKPGGIATALFLVQNEDVSVFYDHPSKSPTRSKEVNKWHLYTIKF